jgi:hypothetical protein
MGMNRFYRTQRTYGHENGGFNLTSVGKNSSCPRTGFAAGMLQLKAHKRAKLTPPPLLLMFFVLYEVYH